MGLVKSFFNLLSSYPSRENKKYMEKKERGKKLEKDSERTQEKAKLEKDSGYKKNIPEKEKGEIEGEKKESQQKKQGKW